VVSEKVGFEEECGWEEGGCGVIGAFSENRLLEERF